MRHTFGRKKRKKKKKKRKRKRKEKKREISLKVRPDDLNRFLRIAIEHEG
jgi:hypothetical protein